MAEINTSIDSKKISPFRKARHLHSTRVDLTPMVDLGFLLITFFVFTTSMSQPTAMNLIEPKNGEDMLVKQSGTMTIILSKNHQMYFYNGILDEQFAANQIKKISFQDIRSQIAGKKNTTPISDLMFIIKSDSTSTFGDHVDLLDEMTICNIPAGHYSQIDITGTESDILKSTESYIHN